jgi:23S rRNA G2445 N2-methylase RlmL
MTRIVEPSKILATCPKGLPPFLRKELQALGFPVEAETIASVETRGTLADTMLLNLQLRTANRVLFLLDQFTARNADELYLAITRLAWEDYIPQDGYLSVTSAVDNPTIKDSRFANLRCKDAIVDRIKARCGQRPDSGSERKGALVFLYWKGEACQVYLDTSGDPLAKRGYRKIPFKAPLQETIAAAVVLATGWEGRGHFLNPMCGSGTLAIEAALLALGRAPGLLRSNFGFMHLQGFDERAWQELRKQVRAVPKNALQGPIIATDINPQAIAAARKNAITAGVDQVITFSVGDYAQTPVPEGGGVVVLNPEYGERLGEVKALQQVYQGIGDFFKQRCSGYRGYLFTGNPDLAKKVGLRASRRIPFFNSKIECRLLEYDLYAGSRRTPPA